MLGPQWDQFQSTQSIKDFAAKHDSLRLLGIRTLYEVADSSAGLKTGRQVGFLSELNALELATLGSVVKALAHGFGEISQDGEECSEIQKRERLCVFEDRYIDYDTRFTR